MKWRDWISAMLCLSSTRILVNGCMTDEIYHARGLLQGDPLSPLLFTLVMDCLAALISFAEGAGLLRPIGMIDMPFRASIYADDVVMFLNPCQQECSSITKLLHLFGEASGLKCNFSKSTITPICYNGLMVESLATQLECPVMNFPWTYLGMPLSCTRLRRVDLQSCFDKIAGRLKSWDQSHMNLDGRLIMVKHVLSAMVVFQMISIDQPGWLLKGVDKLRRGFLWEKKEKASGGKCLVNWSAVCRPLEFGGLGIHNLQMQGTALRMRWLWQLWTDPTKPWKNLPLPIDRMTREMFNASVIFQLGNGAKISFWSDPGSTPTPYAPNTLSCSATVQEKSSPWRKQLPMIAGRGISKISYRHKRLPSMSSFGLKCPMWSFNRGLRIL